MCFDPPYNTNIVMVCNISNVTYSVGGQCKPHTTVPVCSVRMNCIKPPQQRRLNTYVKLTAHGRSSTQRNILPVRHVCSVAKDVYLGIETCGQLSETGPSVVLKIDFVL